MTRSVAVLALLSLVLLAFVGLGWAARTGTALVEYRVAYAYVLPAMIGMLVLVFFPFFYGIALSFTNANIYNTGKSILETWVGLAELRRHPQRLPRRAADGGRAGLELPRISITR